MTAPQRALLLTAAAALLSAAGASEKQEVRFRDVAQEAGVTPVIVSGSPEKNYVLEVNGSGVCWFDYDSDGWTDLYLVNGATIEQLRSGKEPETRNYLFRNRGDGTFEDVTLKAGVPGRGWGFGCAAADYDNDGRTDLYVTNFGSNVLYRNDGNGAFTDVTKRAGVGGGEVWSTGAAFGDYDKDGFVDLYVAGYLDFDIDEPPEPGGCEFAGRPVKACGPLGYRGAPDALFRNKGDGTFADVTREAGVEDKALYYGFAVIFDDLDNDGWPDIFVANDSNPSYFYHNQGDGSFTGQGVVSGLGYSGDGKVFSDMGVAAGDYDNDSLTDLFITTFADDNYALFHNDGGGFFTDVSYPSGLGEPTIPWLGWATFFFDYDHDGRRDLFAANGHVYPEIDGVDGESYAQPLQLFRNVGEGRFREASGQAGFAKDFRVAARGGAYCDYDNDGDLDIAVSRIDGRPLLLRNEGGNRRNWLQLKLVGEESNRDAVGAKVEVAAGGLTQYDHVRAGGSYLSAHDLRLHFGLGPAEEVERVVIRWPSGRRDTVEALEANQILAVTEGGEVSQWKASSEARSQPVASSK